MRHEGLSKKLLPLMKYQKNFQDTIIIKYNRVIYAPIKTVKTNHEYMIYNILIVWLRLQCHRNFLIKGLHVCSKPFPRKQPRDGLLLKKFRTENG